MNKPSSPQSIEPNEPVKLLHPEDEPDIEKSPSRQSEHSQAQHDTTKQEDQPYRLPDLPPENPDDSEIDTETEQPPLEPTEILHNPVSG